MAVQKAKVNTVIRLDPKTKRSAILKAEMLGIDLSKYIRTLIEQDLKE